VSAPRSRLIKGARLELGDYPIDAAWSADGRALVLACGEGEILWWQPTSAPAPELLGTHAGGALAVAWQGAGQHFASSGQDGQVWLWDARERTHQRLRQSAQWSEQLAFASHGRLLAVASGRELALYDASGQLKAALPPHPGVIAALAWRQKSSELVTAFNGGVRWYRCEPELEVREYPWSGACLTASWSPDGRVFASGLQDGTVHFWYLAAGENSQMKGYGAKVALTCWSANSRYLASAADTLIVVWDFSGRGPEGTRPIQLNAHTARLTQLAYQPGGQLLASGGRDCRLMLWQPAQGSEALDADLLPDEIALLRWSPDGRSLLAADRSGALTLYGVERA
jgi:WD40 repeat protein